MVNWYILVYIYTIYIYQYIYIYIYHIYIYGTYFPKFVSSLCLSNIQSHISVPMGSSYVSSLNPQVS